MYALSFPGKILHRYDIINPQADSLLFAAVLLLLQPIQIEGVDPVFQLGGLSQLPKQTQNQILCYRFALLLGQQILYPSTGQKTHDPPGNHHASHL